MCVINFEEKMAKLKFSSNFDLWEIISERGCLLFGVGSLPGVLSLSGSRNTYKSSSRVLTISDMVLKLTVT